MNKGEKNDKTDNGEKMKQEENVYDYYGYNYFRPWMRRFAPQNKEKDKDKEKEKPEDNNKINNIGAPSSPNMNNPYGNNDYSQWPQYGPWNYGYGGFGFGWPPYGHGGFGYGYGQPPYPHNPQPQEQSPQEQPPENEGNFEDMPFYDPYFGYNYQFGQNQGENNNNNKKPE